MVRPQSRTLATTHPRLPQVQLALATCGDSERLRYSKGVGYFIILRRNRIADTMNPPTA